MNRLKTKNFIHGLEQLILAIGMLMLVACKGGGGNKFDVLDVTSDEGHAPVVVDISTYSPSSNPVQLTSTSTTTFAVSLAASDPTVNYTFLLDNTTTLQSGSDPFYVLDASTITSGSHTLKVTAQNATSSDNHTFNLVKNSPISFDSFTPALLGTNLACGIDDANFSVLYSDANLSDTATIRWYLNGSQVNFGNATATVTNDPANNIALINFHPTCAQGGINFIRLDINDGHEITSQTWTVFVTAPITIHISDSTPSTDPTVLTSATSATFAVSLAVPDPSATYNFILDNAVSVQDDNRAYYNISGSVLSPGNHTLKVVATNSTSNDIKIFNIRKNTAPSVSAFTPNYTGNSVGCGTTPVTIYADMLDVNGDSLSYTWLLDDAPSGYLIPANTSSRAQVSFTPHCSLTGTRVIKAIVSDGYESTTVTWSYQITSPINIQITSYLPSTNPTVITGSQTLTFAIALSNSDPNVTYSFVLKNVNTNATSTLQSGSVPFYNLVGSSISAGLYELTVSASNGSSSDQHVFNVRKNAPPGVPKAPLTYSPTSTNVTLSCGSGSQLFQSYITDDDNDIMAVTWTLDGASGVANLVSSSSQTEAQATYSPSCAEVGVKTVRVDVYDGYETSSRSWTVTVVNPTIVTINGYSPSTDPIDVLSTGSQIFTVSATGKAPLAYEWKLDGSVIASSTGAYTTITAASLTTGTHTLIAKVSDADSNDTHTFNIIKNEAPSITNKSPSLQSQRINVNAVQAYSANYADANSDTMTITWKLNNSTVSAGNTWATVSTNATTSTLTFSPTSALIGDNTIELIINDGKESTSYTWSTNVNYYSDICNNMAAGRACTILGRPGLGSGVNPVTSQETVRVQPGYFAQYGSTTSYFFTDVVTNTVWFYNRTGSDISILGQTFYNGKMQIVTGVGFRGTGTLGSYYYDFPLWTPRGVAWDNTNQRLFIAEEQNDRVLMIDSTGTVTKILGGGSNVTANNQDNTISTNSFCDAPRGLEFDGTNNKLYVACYSSGTIKVVDTSNATVANWTANILTGKATGGVTANAAAVNGTNGYAGTTVLNGPNQLKLDTQNNILYFSTTADCRVRATNLTASARTNYYFNAITLAASSTTTLVGSSCGSGHTGGAYGSVVFQGSHMGIELHMSGSTLLGLIVTDFAANRVGFINNTSNTIMLGGSNVASYQEGAIWGNGTAGYYMPCSSATSATCYVNNPFGLMKIGSTLYLADYSNYRVRKLDVSTTDGAVTDDIGYDTKRGFAGNGGTSSENVQFFNPMNLYYDTNGDKIYISDFSNYRIRSLNVNTGRIDSFIGSGTNGNANTSNADPSVLNLRGPRNIVNYNNYVIYGDNLTSNCLYRVLNTSSTTQTILGVSTNGNAVQTIAGNYANGCGAWNASAVTGTDSNAKLNYPQGIATDGTNIYFANTSSHCLIKVDYNGAMSLFAGACGTSGPANTLGTAFGEGSIRFNVPTAVVIDPRYATYGNLFVLDQTRSGTPLIRYINQKSTSVDVYGVTVGAGEIKTIYSSIASGYGTDIAAYDNQICMALGGDYSGNGTQTGTASNSAHNVYCIDRDDSNGTSYSRIGRLATSYTAKGAIQYNEEEEGIAASGISLAGPAGLAFDESGNLYIAEKDGHVIRMVKKWW